MKGSDGPKSESDCIEHCLDHNGSLSQTRRTQMTTVVHYSVLFLLSTLLQTIVLLSHGRVREIYE